MEKGIQLIKPKREVKVTKIFQLPVDLSRWLEDFAKRNGVSQVEVVEQSLTIVRNSAAEFVDAP